MAAQVHARGGGPGSTGVLGYDEVRETSDERLANATSPYLLQHANNPVAWHPEALERALSVQPHSEIASDFLL